MKLIVIVLAGFLLCSFTEWLTDFQLARLKAAEKGQPILLSFSGSDWCIPCIKQKKEIFETAAFKSFADSNLILLNADFPRGNKNKLSLQQVKHNEALAEKYDPSGKFPFTVLLNADGKVLKEWDGSEAISTATIIDQIKHITDEGKR